MAHNSRRTNTLLWTAQILLALLFLFAGTMKFVLPIEKMTGPMGFSAAFIHFIGTVELLGAFGLILPGLFRVATALTSLAAAGLVVIMIGATTLTVISMGVLAAVFPFVVGVFAASIAYGRWRVAPLAERRVTRALHAA
ncbi:MAG: DoxX family protein [Gemmatimonadales bacterium]